ncbi:Uncharacterised protein [Legionella beliardensis]|uniref:Swiss Army Knife 2H phosphoesterase domain-containing protein n=1 Tax=Legionella beliardensis TaxID=91822 RepID=A0A378I3M0_9GAMM|nr:hypothetical protein [Legionella beliardensis]STX29286.1 Uncharacterised protein [Legionella beliardensis]
MKTPIIKHLTAPRLMSTAAQLSLQGKLAISANNLVYLDIDNNYIHHLYPLLGLPQVVLPNYFNQDGIGAHISVIYPEELHSVSVQELGNTYQFSIQELVSAQFEHKIYYVLLVKSAELLELRRRYHFKDYLNFKGYKIDFHITIGKSL